MDDTGPASGEDVPWRWAIYAANSANFLSWGSQGVRHIIPHHTTPQEKMGTYGTSSTSDRNREGSEWSVHCSFTSSTSADPSVFAQSGYRTSWLELFRCAQREAEQANERMWKKADGEA